jgi:hypothetical protein
MITLSIDYISLIILSFLFIVLYINNLFNNHIIIYISLITISMTLYLYILFKRIDIKGIIKIIFNKK